MQRSPLLPLNFRLHSKWVSKPSQDTVISILGSFLESDLLQNLSGSLTQLHMMELETPPRSYQVQLASSPGLLEVKTVYR